MAGLTKIFEDRNGTSLEDWLENTPNQGTNLQGKRIFYIIKPNFEDNGRKIIKFGTAGNNISKRTSTAAYDRLKSYLAYYGRKNQCPANTPNCKYGVTLYAVYGTNYSSRVAPTQTAVHKKELQMKSAVKSDILNVGRGRERTSWDVDRLLNILKNSPQQDIATGRFRMSPRVAGLNRVARAQRQLAI